MLKYGKPGKITIQWPFEILTSSGFQLKNKQTKQYQINTTFPDQLNLPQPLFFKLVKTLIKKSLWLVWVFADFFFSFPSL